MPYCSVFGCSNNKGTHRFPNRDNSPVRFNKWTNISFENDRCKVIHFPSCSRIFSKFGNSLQHKQSMSLSMPLQYPQEHQLELFNLPS